jgi:agmatinase
MNDSRKSKLLSFDPNDVGATSNQIFGLPFDIEESQIVLLPVPWDVTVSYGGGCSGGPEAIKSASYQIDLHDPDNMNGWQAGIAMLDIPEEWTKRSAKLRQSAERYIEWLSTRTSGEPVSHGMQSVVDEVNSAGEELRNWVSARASELMDKGKIVGLVGGDHSTPLGYLDAIAARHEKFGILQIDAHCDLRNAYEGFKYSHASIMWNALDLPQVDTLVQVGIRDYSASEASLISGSKGRIRTFFDADLKRARFEGGTWKESCASIIAALPAKVYISFDIDGLDPKLCPNTGTPVPGGMEFEEAIYLIREVVQSGRQIVGFDLCEVTPGESEWDANVGARVLYKMCNLILKGSNVRAS